MLSMYTFKDNYMEIRPFSWSFLLWRGDTLSKRSHGIQEIYVNNIIDSQLHNILYRVQKFL